MPSHIWLYGLPLFFIMLFYLWKKSKTHTSSLKIYNEAVDSGLTEPASLHPEIDPTRCLGCASCVIACPEKNVLGVIAGKASLINPTHCIGHGACKKACPFDAIELVFGTEKRGVDIPLVNEDFQTNVPGIFIAGELGGMGLIRNAINQGIQAVDSVRKMDGIGADDKLDLVIVGAGPAGIAAALAAKSHNLNFTILEQDSIGGTVSHYPRGKIVMTAPAKLPIIGKMHFKETTKEALMEFWKKVIDKAELEITERQSVESIEKETTGFQVNTQTDEYHCRAVLLTIGRRGTPRKLGVPGEEHSKVVYRLIDPQQYKNQNVLVVGGGDSALEAAVSIAAEEGTMVTISYRSEAFSRAKEKNRNKIATAEQQGQLNVMLKSTVKEINKDSVAINSGDDVVTIDNDAIIVCAGGILPTAFLEKSGITVETKYGTA
jgi:putative YpdA family bacillithiol system oxidoreductase